LTGNTTLSTGIWYHAAITRTGSAGNWTVKLYLNGILDGSTTTAVNPNATNEKTAIGRAGNISAQYFSGQIDEPKIFNYALTPTQIKTLMNNGAVKFGN